VEELYLQYGGGVRKHPLAISRFCAHLLAEWPSAPAHLFLIGKSIHEMTVSANTGARRDPALYERNLVPTWGWPPSDAMFTAHLNAPAHLPLIPTGRLSAESPDQVTEYLAKVVQAESAPPARWQKRILHFGGGGNAFEQGLFSNYLAQYAAVARDTSYAAEVFTFLKNTTDPIQMNMSDSIRTLIDGGVAVMTFFGHASSTGFDQNLDAPENYGNQGRYPLLIGNSCYTGNIHLAESQSASERFVRAPQRGVIGFLAKSDLGIPTYLDQFTGAFYRNLFRERYGATIGQCMIRSMEEMMVPGDFYRENTALTFALHGDPSLSLYARALPDCDIGPADILFDPPQVTAQMDSFQVVVRVHNPGKAVHAPVSVELIRRYPDGGDTALVKMTSRLFSREEVVFILPVDPLRGAGQNLFDVFVDYPEDLVEELEEVTNNRVIGKALWIASGELIPAFPYEFAVVPAPQVTLRAGTALVPDAPRTYVMQVDTTDRFNSPAFAEHEVLQAGGVVEWALPFALADSAVYFWRCSPDSLSPDQPYRWRTSSFQHIAGVSGWGQDHFFQFGENARTGLTQNIPERKWEFAPLQAMLRAEVFGNPATSFEALGTRFMLNLDVQDYSGPGNTPCIMVAVLDPASLEPWESNYNGANPGNDFGNSMASAAARNRPEKYFIFEQHQPDQLAGLADMLTNRIPDGHYLLAYTWRYATYDTWSAVPQLADAWASLGAVQIGQGTDSVPFVFFMRMGDPASRLEYVGSSSGDDLVLEQELTGRQDFGSQRSPHIGPAAAWEGLNWKISGVEPDSADSLTVRLYGTGEEGEQVLLGEWTEPQSEGIAADEVPGWQDFPYSRLELITADSEEAVPAQLLRWHVSHAPAPDCALDPSAGYYLTPGPVREGQTVQFALAVRNISDRAMDSLLVRYSVEDAQGVLHPLGDFRSAPLPPGAWTLDTILIETTGLAGHNRIVMEANPRHMQTGIRDQPEHHHFNNIARIPFEVTRDRTNPLLDVTFDGMHILNRDIVSARPEIVIRLDDDNPVLLLNEPSDTALFRIYITEPGRPARPVYFSGDELEWHPAADERNRSEVVYRPHFPRDGIHLLLVQAGDKSGNASGRSDFRVEFEVISRPTISEVLNYPNPFSTQTRFVFTLTGTEPPDRMKIQIMTAGGRVVREITQDELGPLRIGRNMTHYAWDGRDEFGDPLANGVYLYRVSARMNGEDLEIREDSARSFTRKGVGKMYLMR
jgi:hypothetical protein